MKGETMLLFCVVSLLLCTRATQDSVLLHSGDYVIGRLETAENAVSMITNHDTILISNALIRSYYAQGKWHEVSPAISHAGNVSPMEEKRRRLHNLEQNLTGFSFDSLSKSISNSVSNGCYKYLFDAVKLLSYALPEKYRNRNESLQQYNEIALWLSDQEPVATIAYKGVLKLDPGITVFAVTLEGPKGRKIYSELRFVRGRLLDAKCPACDNRQCIGLYDLSPFFATLEDALKEDLGETPPAH